MLFERLGRGLWMFWLPFSIRRKRQRAGASKAIPEAASG
jgi:hypothetical protein